MQQLVMQTLQAVETSAKYSAKKPQTGTEKKSDFGKKLEDMAANNAQAVAGESVQPEADVPVEPAAEVPAEGTLGIGQNQSYGLLDQMAMQDWTAVQGMNLRQTAPEVTVAQQTEITGLTAPEVQDGQAVNIGHAAENIVSQTPVHTAEAKPEAAAKTTADVEIPDVGAVNVKTEEASEDFAGLQQNAQKEGSQVKEVTRPEEKTTASSAAASESDVKEVVSEAVAGRPQDYTVTDVRTAAAKETFAAQEMKPEYADMIKDMIARQISDGKQELEIRLTPRSLGDLTVKVAYHDGAASVSIICSDKRALQAMSQKAGELGMILENNLGNKTEVIVETRQQEQMNLYEDGRGNQSRDGQQSSKEQQSEKQHNETETVDFLQQLRLGIRKENEYIWQ